MKMRMLFAGMMVFGPGPTWAQEEREHEKPIEVAEDVETVDDDPFGPDLAGRPQPLNADRGARRTMSVLVRIEWFEVPTLKAVELLDGWEIKAGADGLRKQVLEMVNAGEATIHDMKAATVEVGSKAVLEGIHEFIYPTEYVPPSGLRELKEMKAEPPTRLAELFKTVNDHFFPTAFETRNTGSTFEFEIGLVTAEEGMWDVRLAPELVEFAGMETYGPEGIEAEMPLFNSTRTSSSFRARDGVWCLVAMQTPYKGKERNHEVKQFQFVKVEAAR